MKKRTQQPFVFAFGLMLAVTSSLQGAVLLNDTFTDGDYTNGTDANDTQWRIHSNSVTGTKSAASGALVIGRATTNGNGFNPGAVGTFTPTTLAVGQTIVLTFDAIVTGGTVLTPGGAVIEDAFRFGLYNSGGTNLSGDLVGNPPGTGSIFHDDVGYSVFAPQHTTGSASLRYRTTTTAANALQISVGANASIGTGSITTATTSGTPFIGSLSIARVNTNEYNLIAGFNGNTWTATSTPLLATDTFDTVGFFSLQNQTNMSLSLDNVKVEVIPEPSPAAVLGLAATLALFRRRTSH